MILRIFHAFIIRLLGEPAQSIDQTLEEYFDIVQL